jgi:hypothetical protein
MGHIFIHREQKEGVRGLISLRKKMSHQAGERKQTRLWHVAGGKGKYGWWVEKKVTHMKWFWQWQMSSGKVEFMYICNMLCSIYYMYYVSWLWNISNYNMYCILYLASYCNLLYDSEFACNSWTMRKLRVVVVSD